MKTSVTRKVLVDHEFLYFLCMCVVFLSHRTVRYGTAIVRYGTVLVPVVLCFFRRQSEPHVPNRTRTVVYQIFQYIIILLSLIILFGAETEIISIIL